MYVLRLLVSVLRGSDDPYETLDLTQDLGDFILTKHL